MKNYYRLTLGHGNMYAQECFAQNFVGVNFGIHQDLSNSLPAHLSDFNKAFIPVYLSLHPEKSRIGAGLACGALWTVTKGICKGDLVLCPDGQGVYRVGELTGEYFYNPGPVLPHRRAVRWLPTHIPRSVMSESLRSSAGTQGTVTNLTAYGEEIEVLLTQNVPRAAPAVPAPEIEDSASFDMEKHLEDFLIKNWALTGLNESFSIYKGEGEVAGQQYLTEAGAIDILAVSKDKKRLLVIELKRGRASDTVVGQTLRYVGYVKEQIAEPTQEVEGAIIAFEDDPKLRWALKTVPHIKFYRYQVSFKLIAS